MRRLSGIDADMLYGETPSSHMHVSALLILDPSTAAGDFGFATWRRLLASEVEHLPPLRERAVPVPFGLDRPFWVDDPGFDLDRHLHRVAVPAPGGARELSALVGDLASTKLDRSAPLWEMWFIEGVERGRVAVLSKIHHACLDGVAGAMMLGHLFRTEPVAPPESADFAWKRKARLPSGPELMLRSLGSSVRTPLRAARALRETVTALGRLSRMGAAGEAIPPALPFQAPRTSLNRAVTPRRCFAFAEVPLARVKAVRKVFDVTVNDVVLALCSGALRRYLETRGEPTDEPLVAAVPVSTRSEHQMGRLGNVVSGLFASLATDVADPVERLRAVSAATRSAKRLYETGIEDAAMRWASVPRPLEVALAVRFLSWLHLSQRLPPIFNLLISNVPGPPGPLYAGGAKLVACYPMGPLVDRVALNITVMSYADGVGFGFLTCPDVVRDPWAIAAGVRDALDELLPSPGARP
jgi:diacylglycerol O-acyltransferase